MFTFFMICAAIGCTIMIMQFLMLLCGVGGDHDVGHDTVVHLGGADAHVDVHHGGQGNHDSSWFFRFMSFRALVAALAFFGLTGLAMLESGAGPYLSILFSAAAGACAMVVVAWMMRLFAQLSAEGTVHIHNAIGSTGTVYLSIPGAHAGRGKVTIKIQNRTMEYPAMTADDDLKCGQPVVVLDVLDNGVLEVAATGNGREKE